MIDERRLLSKVGLAESLGVHPRTINNYMKRGLPKIRMGYRTLRFDYDEVITWLKENNDYGEIKYLSPSPSEEIK